MEYVGEADWTGVALHGEGYFGETPLVGDLRWATEAFLAMDRWLTAAYINQANSVLARIYASPRASAHASSGSAMKKKPSARFEAADDAQRRQ